jgi:predicted benzoate:H+ symporter BenE
MFCNHPGIEILTLTKSFKYFLEIFEKLKTAETVIPKFEMQQRLSISLPFSVRLSFYHLVFSLQLWI